MSKLLTPEGRQFAADKAARDAKAEEQAAEEQAADMEDYRFPVVMPFGEFMFGVLEIRDQIGLRPAIRLFWNQPMPINGTAEGMADLSSYEYMLASALAEMRAAARTVPKGWDWMTLHDPDQAWELWQGYQKARDMFRKGMGGF
jgi:hypothetical protein